MASFNQQVLGRQIDGKEITSLPNAVIVDWPDHQYRGLMLDVVRNFQSPAEIEKILGYMRDMRLNVLHFHFADDEGWRLQMPSLPELTEVGGRRGYTLDPVADGFMSQYYRGDGNPDNFTTTSNGYFTRQEFIDLLRLADSYGIAVLPEIESPAMLAPPSRPWSGDTKIRAGCARPAPDPRRRHVEVYQRPGLSRLRDESGPGDHLPIHGNRLR